MARKTEFNHVKISSGKWMVSCPPTLSASGKRERTFFKTRDAARDHAAALREKAKLNGENATAIRPALAEDATLAAAVLEPWGLSLLEAARLVAAIREKESASKLLSTAADEWLVACEGLRAKTKQGYKLTAKRLKEALGTRLLATLTADELQAALAPVEMPTSSAEAHIRTAKAFWHWSAEKGWCEAATFKSVKIAKSSAETGEIEILTTAAAEALLTVAAKHFPQSVASFALQLFAGIRAEEIVRMEEKHVNEDGIDLPATVTKKGRRRHITPNATLSAWLAKHPFTPCPNWRETSAAVRRLAGWEVVSAILNERVRVGTSEPLPEPTRGRWPQNALRHSHASYAVASGVALETLLFEFGHTGTANVLREHYVGKASKKQALEFFAITPEGVKAPATIQPVKKSA